MKTPIFNLHDLILVLSLAVCLQLVVFQWLLSRQKAPASLLLSGFFVSVGASALCNLLLWNNYIALDSQLARYGLAVGLVVALVGKSVCLYWYVQAITRDGFQWRPVYAWHWVHGLLALGLIVVGELDSDRLRFASEHTHRSVQLTNFLWHYLKLVPVIYALAAVVVIRRYQRRLEDYYSAFSLQGPWWLLLLTLGFALSWTWSLVVHLLGQHIPLGLADRLGIADNYLTFILVNALFIYSLVYAHSLLVTRDKPKAREPAKAEDTNTEVIAAIRTAMEERELYLVANLNIEEFARQVGVHYREVSAIINSHFNTNFFEFVNSYRIKKAKALLQDPGCVQMTIMDILLASGFNSKSSFNRFFKRYTGMSAADFRKHHQAGEH